VSRAGSSGAPLGVRPVDRTWAIIVLDATSEEVVNEIERTAWI